MSKERRLGRGLEALLGRPADFSGEPAMGEPAREDAFAAAPAATASESASTVRVQIVDSNPYQPRRDFTEDDLRELSESLAAHGLLQPIVVRKWGERYQLISGERRLRAAIKAGWQEVPAHIRDATDREMAELAIVENLQRRDLNALEKGVSFQQYLQQYGCTQEELAGRLKVDRSTIANLIRLLELPTAVQQALRAGSITQGHARALLPLGEEDEQVAFCQRIQQEGLSVRATEELVSETINAGEEVAPLLSTGAGARPKSARPKKSQQLAALEQELRHALGARVDVKLGTRERGKIVIYFGDHDEFERLRDQITGEARARLAG